MTPYAALLRANTKVAVRDRTTVFFTFAFPLLFLVVFGLIFNGQPVEGTSFHYIDFVAPGVLSWGVASASVFGVAFTLMNWRAGDLLRLIRMTPTSLPAVMAARVVLTIVIALSQAVLFVLVALLPPFNLALASSWPAALPFLVLGTVAFMAIGAVIGTFADTAEAVAAVANAVMVPMAFLSGAFLPLAMMPDWLRAVSNVLPLRYMNDGISASLRGESMPAADWLLPVAVFAGVTVLFSAVALRYFRWSNNK